jgi:signal transduction histidine kinase
LTAETSRRSIYFAFQGLFMSVLLLLIVFQSHRRVDYQLLAAYTAILGGSLVVLQLAPARLIGDWWFQALFFISDALAATAVLQWMQPQLDLFLLYLTLVLGSALTRSAWNRLVVSGVAIFLYLLTGWHTVSGWPTTPEFWLRAVFLAISSILLAVLASDVGQEQDEQHRRYEERLVQVGRLATLGRVAGEVAHRIKGPLTTIAVDAEVLAHRLKHDKAALIELREITDEVERCKQILKGLLDLGRIEEMDMAVLDIRDCVRRALKSIASQAKNRGIVLTSHGLAAPMKTRGDTTLLLEAILALLQNALDASTSGGSVRIDAATTGPLHRISIVDEGVGISKPDLERVFEPFFTTKKQQGSGLGLSAALRIAAKHGGSIEVDSAPGLGSRFTLLIPVAPR